MIIILSQKLESKSSYSGDKLFSVYHYPGRYRNQIHTGDTFVYYQGGNELDKIQRYYFGMGKIGAIKSNGLDDYYAELVDVKRFHRTVPIYLPDGGYVEQLGYNTVRNSINPPWQSSIRPLSEEAFNYIIKHSGHAESIADSDEKLKTAIQNYFIFKDTKALFDIDTIAKELIDLYGIKD